MIILPDTSRYYILIQFKIGVTWQRLQKTITRLFETLSMAIQSRKGSSFYFLFFFLSLTQNDFFSYLQQTSFFNLKWYFNFFFDLIYYKFGFPNLLYKSWKSFTLTNYTNTKSNDILLSKTSYNYKVISKL